MIKKVKIEGLDCAHCAKTLENEIKKLKFIKNAEINFVQSSLVFESDDVEALTKIKKLTKKIEPDAKIIDDEQEEMQKDNKKECCHKKQKNLKKHDCCNSENSDEHEHCCHHEENQKTCCHSSHDDCCHKSNQKDCCKTSHGKTSHVSAHKIPIAILKDMLFLAFGLAVGILALTLKTSTAVHYVLLVFSVLLLGYKTYLKAVRLLLRGVVNENLLLTISVAGAIAISKDMEAVMVIALYSIGKILEGLAVNKSRKSIEKITNFKPEFAVVLDGETERKVSPSEVSEGQIILVRPGECVPIDGVILEGSTNLNMQSLTGESLPVLAKTNDKILSGSIVLDSVIKIKTTALYSNSTVSKILNLIENNQQKKSKTETVISKLTKWYTLGVIGLAILTFGIVYLVSHEFQTALYRGLIFLVVSCPCAFAISVPLSYFSGLGNASSHGILIKGSVYLDACAKVNTVVFDKTGTLTTGVFSVQKVEVLSENLTEQDILKLAGAGEQYSLHPLAKCITESTSGKLPKATDVKEVAGEGVYYKIHDRNYFVGRHSKSQSSTCVELYENDVLLGKIYLSDSLKESSKSEIEMLKKMGIKTVLLSGDKQSVVKKIAEHLGCDEFVSELLPQEKSEWLENHKREKNTIAFVGDGLNDAPSLSIADVGFCMGLSGNPASIEASDIVLADDNPSKISQAITISKYTRKIVWENIGFSALIKIVFLSLGAFGITGMLSAVIADVGVTVGAVLNSLRALSHGKNGS